jgi:hypothetical protein
MNYYYVCTPHVMNSVQLPLDFFGIVSNSKSGLLKTKLGNLAVAIV